MSPADAAQPLCTGLAGLSPLVQESHAEDERRQSGVPVLVGSSTLYGNRSGSRHANTGTPVELPVDFRAQQ